jgi:hypothetical protein
MPARRISRSLTTYCVRLELRSLPSTGVTRLQRYYKPLRHPRASGLSLAGVRLVIPDHALGPPVLRTLSLCTCCRQYPGTATGRTTSLNSPTSCQPSPIWQSGRPVHRPFRGLLGVHSRYGLHTRAVTVYRDTLTEGFSHFVTSMTAPVASGWSGCRVGLTPTGKRRLSTAHANSGHSAGPTTRLPRPSPLRPIYALRCSPTAPSRLRRAVPADAGARGARRSAVGA